MSARDDAPVLPATVVAAHLTACAAELAGHTVSGPSVGDLADLTAVVDQLVTGQQRIAAALAGLATRLGRQSDGALAAVDQPDLVALTDVLGAAAAATGHAADALTQSRPVLDIVLAAAGPEARI